MSGLIAFEEMRNGLARITSPPIVISFDEWERITSGLTVSCNGEAQLALEGFRHMLWSELVRQCICFADTVPTLYCMGLEILQV